MVLNGIARSVAQAHVGMHNLSPARTGRWASRACAALPAASVADKVSASTSTSKGQQVVTYSGAEFVVDDNPELRSTTAQRATVLCSAASSALLLWQGIAHSSAAPVTVLAMLAGFVFADLGSGVYHWGVDNYGSASTPIVGSQIAAFQGHHQRPWTITQREFCNNCSLTFKPAGIAAAIFLLLSYVGITAPAWDAFAATSIFFIAMSQQFHAWSHMKKSELPPVVVWLQDRNVIVSRRVHGAHHRSPFDINYCIVSGWCNPVLDGGLLHSLEKGIHRATGVEPRGWSEPGEDWRELVPTEGA